MYVQSLEGCLQHEGHRRISCCHYYHLCICFFQWGKLLTRASLLFCYYFSHISNGFLLFLLTFVIENLKRSIRIFGKVSSDCSEAQSDVHQSRAGLKLPRQHPWAVSVALMLKPFSPESDKWPSCGWQ